jgi:hypothetical protein
MENIMSTNVMDGATVIETRTEGPGSHKPVENVYQPAHLADIAIKETVYKDTVG